jgi:DNA-binding winged helix-turn-helix (wHTH) protein
MSYESISEGPVQFLRPTGQLSFIIGHPGKALHDSEVHQLPAIPNAHGYRGISVAALKETLETAGPEDILWVSTTEPQPIEPVSTFVNGRLTLNRPSGKISVDGITRHMPPRAFSVLDLLAQNSDTALAKSTIYDACWGPGYSAVTTRTLDVHIRHVRVGLGDLAWTVQTVRAFGYRFSDIPEELSDT